MNTAEGTGRRRMVGAGLLAGGVLTGAVLAGTLSANAARRVVLAGLPALDVPAPRRQAQL